MLIALFPNSSKPSAFEIARRVSQFLTRRGVSVAVTDSEAAELGLPKLSNTALEKIDFAISLGGDGTILHLVQTYPDLQAPIIGINLGNLGFMADIPLSELYSSLEDFLNGHYRVESRITMEGHFKGQTFYALNDIVVHRCQNPSLIGLALWLDEVYLNTFKADGIIVATPSGSTAYSLASGGPILTPELEALVLTPISAHTISNRPIVFMPKKQLQIEYTSSLIPIEVSFDGKPRLSLHPAESFSICRSPRIFKLVTLLRRDYFSTLRSKLGWAGTFNA